MSMPKGKKPTRAAKSRKAPSPLFLLSQAEAMLPLVTHIAEDIQARWQRLLELLEPGWVLLHCGPDSPCALPPGVTCLRIGHDAHDRDGVFRQRYDARPGSSWLVRPDQHLAARFRAVDAAALAAATRRALGWEMPS